MEDLRKQTIVFIYPDGEVGKIPITHFRNHRDYFLPALYTSERLVKVREEMQIDWDILRVCACNDIITMFNLNIVNIIGDPMFTEYDYASFDIYFPETLKSMEQLTSYLEIINNYPIDELNYNQFQIELKDFKKIENNEQKEEFIENNRNRLESEIPKL